MQKCDGCATRVHMGMEPACVRVCPTGALRLVDSAEWENADPEHSLKKAGEAVLSAQV